MKVGLQINRFDYPGGDNKIGQNVHDVSIAAEQAGFDSIWVMDHFFQLEHIGQYTEPMLESYTTLGYIAGITNKVKLGTMVTGVIYREPALLINAVTTLDVISGGRAYLGIGAGWNEQEAKALGLLNPLQSRRFERLEDTLKLALQMWSGDSQAFNGNIYNLPEPYLSPQPITKPHPPILIGGGGEEKTLRLVAKYGDACNLFAHDIDILSHKLEVLKKHCQEVNRPYEEIEKTSLIGVNIATALKDFQQTIDQAKTLKSLGIEHIIFANSHDIEASAYSQFSKIVRIIHDLND